MSALRSIMKDTIARSINILALEKIIGLSTGAVEQPLIICYHRVVQDYEAAARRSIDSMLISTRMFTQQIEWIDANYNLMSLDEISHLPPGNSTIRGKRAAAITFDDGYADFYWNAFPVLKSKGIPSAVFVVSDLVGTEKLHVHDELFLLLSAASSSGRFGSLAQNAEARNGAIPRDAIVTDLSRSLQSKQGLFSAMRYLLATLDQRQLHELMEGLRGRYELGSESLREFYSLSWEMLSAVQQQGVIIGSHTASHALLPRHDRTDVERELVESRALLEKRLGKQIKHLAYPDGQFCGDVVQAAAVAGYENAYTICNHRSKKFPHLTVPRKVLWQKSCLDHRGQFSPAILGCQSNGIFDHAARCAQVHLSV